MRLHIPTRHRYQAKYDTMATAKRRAAKPSKADIEFVLTPVRSAYRALTRGVATELQWSILAGSLDVAQAIERQGVVRGLHNHFAAAAAALQAVHARSKTATSWRNAALRYDEMDALHTFVDLHSFQVKQLGRAEFLRAIDSAEASRKANGGAAS